MHCLTETCCILYICLYVYVLVCLSFIYVICFFIIIFITIYHIISLTQKKLFFGHVCQKFRLRALLSFWLIFCRFQPGVAYESVSNKKTCTLSLSRRIYHLLSKKHSVMELVWKVWDIQGITLSVFELIPLTTKKRSWKFSIIF